MPSLGSGFRTFGIGLPLVVPAATAAAAAAATTATLARLLAVGDGLAVLLGVFLVAFLVGTLASLAGLAGFGGGSGAFTRGGLAVGPPLALATAAALALFVLGGVFGVASVVTNGGGAGRSGLLLALFLDVVLDLFVLVLGRVVIDGDGQRPYGQLVAELGLDTVHAVVGGDQRVVAGQHHHEAVALLHGGQCGALLIEDIERDGGRHRDGDLGGPPADALLLDGAQHMHGGRFDRADQAGAGAMRAGGERGFLQAGTQPLA